MPTIAAVLSPANAFGTLALSQKLRRRWRFFAWYLIAQLIPAKSTDCCWF
jgi:hypothetical protein